MLVGLSTHSEAEIDAVDPALVDYIGVGPVHETPTKEGRPAVGVELVRYAAAHAPVPFFAIGGLNAANIGEVIAAGADARGRAARDRRRRRPGGGGARAARRAGRARRGRAGCGGMSEPAAAEHAALEDAPPPSTRRRADARRAARGASRAGARRDEAARDALQPLGPGERPPALLIAIAVCARARRRRARRRAQRPRPQPPRRLAPRRGDDRDRPARCSLRGCGSGATGRCSAFEALLAFQIIVTSLALVVASTLPAAAGCTVAIGLGGWLFWKLVRVMGRIQAGEVRAPR